MFAFLLGVILFFFFLFDSTTFCEYKFILNFKGIPLPIHNCLRIGPRNNVSCLSTRVAITWYGHLMGR